MERLPSSEEREWLAGSLRQLVSRRAGILDSAPLVEPTHDWFPEPWSMTAAHGHRLAQRLMHYAGLGDLRLSLDAFEPEWSDDDAPWDAGTAGWFAGIDRGRAHFGLHVDQFDDPEKAAGVLAHEVAHAWRAHHRLVVDDRDEEELLTDLTTIVLGFGILSTNITDRYRSSGTWETTTWSISSAGYLPPQAMAYALALWCEARGDPRERRAIERHLEPNQLASFHAAMGDLGNARELLAAGAVPEPARRMAPGDFTPVDPRPNEISEPEVEAEETRNRGRTVYRKARGDTAWLAFFGAMPGFLFGWIVGLMVFGRDAFNARIAGLAFGCAAVTSILAIRHSRKSVCSECNAPAPDDAAICTGCGGTLGWRVTLREYHRIREEELERRAARDVGYDECDECEPERPCRAHAASIRFVAPVDERTAIETSAPSPAPPRRPFLPATLVLAVAVLAILGGFAWRRQNRVRVYFDNAIPRPLTLKLGDETIPLVTRPVVRELAPGIHRIVILDGGRELERFDADVTRQSLFDALLAPHFFVYSVAGAGIYRRAEYVYARAESDQRAVASLIALERWIEQGKADFVFAEPPDRLPVSGRKLTRTSFAIASDATWRDVAWQWSANGRAADSIRALRKGIEIQPCDDSARNDLVYFLESKNDPKAARAETAAWIAACDSIPAHRVQQDLLRKDGHSLVAEYRERMQRNPNAANHYLYGRLLRGPAAIAEHREALRLDPDLMWPRFALGHELLAAEEDGEAYEIFEALLRGRDFPAGTAADFARAAVARGNEDDALAFLATRDHLDPWSLFEARWILLRSKKDWNGAKVALAEYERGEKTPETNAMRAAIEWEAGGPPETDELRFQDALEHGRAADASSLGNPIYAIHAVAAAILARAPDARSRIAALRSELRDPAQLALLDVLEGKPESDEVLDAGIAPHAWFMRAVHASAEGNRAEATRLFTKAAERTLDRGFPYRLALQHATAHAH